MRNKPNLFLLVIILFFANSFIIFSQDLSKINKLVLLNVGNEEITYEQLERAYQKNVNKNKPHLYLLEKDSLLDFINLYANFRLKVLEAKRKGLDKDSAIIAESNQNRKILSENYLFTKKLIEPNVEKMLERRKWEYKFAIIFTTYPQAPTRDTTKAYEKITQAMNEIKNGADFDAVAMKYNDDENLARRAGKVDQWITSGKIHREIEDAIYSTPVGEVHPNIISTPFGYFIVKVLEKQPRKWVLGGHILLKNELDSALGLIDKQEKAQKIIDRIKKGEKFEDLALTESDDTYTASNKGKFEEYYSRSTGFEKNKGLLDPRFVDALFELKKGEISKPVMTDFGTHIIKYFDDKELDLTAEKDDVYKIYRSQYLGDDKQVYLEKLMKELNFELKEDVFNEMMTLLDTNKSNINKNWSENIPQELKKKTLYTISNKKTSVGEFIEEMNKNNILRGYATNKDGILSAIKKLCEPICIDYATKDLENQFPDFKVMLNEFNDGILLFKAETAEVWDKLKFDSTRARKYFDTTKIKYYTDPMYDITEIYVLSDSLAQEIYKSAINGANFEELAEQYTQRSGYRERSGKMGLVSGNTNKYAKLLAERNITDPIIVQPIKVENGYSIMKINKYEPPRLKTFEEAIPDFASKLQEQYQKELLNKWLSNLRKTFPVKINQKNVDQVVKFAQQNTNKK